MRISYETRMARTELQMPSAFISLQAFLLGLDFRRLGWILAALTAAVFLIVPVIAEDFSYIMQAFLLGFLVVLGLLSIAGLASGVLAVAPFDDNEGEGWKLLDNLPEGVLVTDESNNVLYANAAYLGVAKKVLGEPDKKDIPAIGQLFCGEVAAAEPLYRLIQAVKSGHGWQEEFRIVGSGAGGRPAGKASEPAWYRISVDHLHNNTVANSQKTWRLPAARAGRFARADRLTIWQIAEITSERQLQEESLGKLQEIIDYLDQAPAGFFSADHEGRIDYLNATLAEWLGLDLADAVASHLLLSDFITRDGAIMLTQAALSGRDGEKKTFDLDLVRQDGTSLPVRMLHQTFLDPSGGHQSRTLVLNRSFGTESQEALRAAEVRFARFYHSAPIAIATVDKNGLAGSTNAAFARMFAKNIKEASGDKTDIVSLVTEENREEVLRALQRASTGQVKISPVNVSFSGELGQTGRLYFSPAGSIDHESGDEFGDAILYAIDTTDQKTMEMRMVQGQKMAAVGQLAGGIAHDFNNVLTAIILGTDELLGSIRPTDPGFRDIISIKQNANRAASLVRQILAFSRRQTLRPEKLNLNDVVSNLSILLDRLLGDNVKLNMERHRDLWMVNADVIQFEQVIMNLAVNARDAMPAGGTVTISTRNISQRMSAGMSDEGMQVGEYVLIQVSDTGSGMTREIRDKVFEPFFTTKGVGKGTGLGLSTVYGIVKQTGGFIYVDSEVGEGTSFRIYLPRCQEEPEDADQQKARKQAGQKKGKPDLTGTETILLVEDEEAVRGFSARALRKRGYEVFEAGTGVQALEVMNEVEGRIDLVVSDVMMPEMDGPTMAREMRRAKPDLKIIFVSGFAREVLDQEEDFIFMSKPYGLKDLAAKVKEVLAG